MTALDFSLAGQKLTGHSGILELMDDLGRAMTVVYYSQHTHYSATKIIRVLAARSMMIRGREDGEIDYDDLRETLKIHRDVPPIILANIGTTMHGDLPPTRCGDARPRWQIAPSRDIAHINPLPHVTRAMIDAVVADVASSLNQPKCLQPNQR